MRIRNVLHKGLKRFIEGGDASGLQPAVVGEIGRLVSFLQDMSHEDELQTVPTWKAHRLTGDRKCDAGSSGHLSGRKSQPRYMGRVKAESREARQ